MYDLTKQLQLLADESFVPAWLGIGDVCPQDARLTSL